MSFIYIDSNTDIELVKDFCEDSYSEVKESRVNYHTEDWMNNPNTLLHKIYIQKTYDENNRGAYVAMTIDDKIVCAAGLNCYNMDDKTCLFLTRAYTRIAHRHNTKMLKHMMNYLLLDKAIQYGYLAGIVSFNEYNLRLRQNIHNINKLENFPDHVKIDGKYYKHENGTQILPTKLYDYPVMLNHTKQYLLYFLIDETYETNLLSILDSQRI